MSDTEKAIETIQELKKKYVLDPETRYHMALIKAEGALQKEAERDNPHRLTLDELEERIGKPVYFIGLNVRRWRIVGKQYPYALTFNDGGSTKIEDGNYKGLAYDYEPNSSPATERQ